MVSFVLYPKYLRKFIIFKRQSALTTIMAFIAPCCARNIVTIKFVIQKMAVVLCVRITIMERNVYKVRDSEMYVICLLRPFRNLMLDG